MTVTGKIQKFKMREELIELSLSEQSTACGSPGGHGQCRPL